ncbi:MAG: hypothetical protein ETSY1_41965 [Candidatus Entotheonella factor]|uniref:Uncharacterized protein n=1 Tax=Entotheonella factor TaxID=1429438 RepID=W4L684_ENTF1|nr:MAG: hypothetical protein ETSY1_41965 [Candidatus Entotheonella factor]
MHLRAGPKARANHHIRAMVDALNHGRELPRLMRIVSIHGHDQIIIVRKLQRGFDACTHGLRQPLVGGV